MSLRVASVVDTVLVRMRTDLTEFSSALQVLRKGEIVL